MTHDKDTDALRSRFNIPSCYFFDGEFDNGRALFSFCDSTIEVDPASGQAWETHMGLNPDASSHQFVTSPWPKSPQPPSAV